MGGLYHVAEQQLHSGEHAAVLDDRRAHSPCHLQLLQFRERVVISFNLFHDCIEYLWGRCYADRPDNRLRGGRLTLSGLLT